MKHLLYLCTICLEVMILAILLSHGHMSVKAGKTDLAARRELVQNLQLTDLAIWSEARYTRHPSQADNFSPFQEFPGAIDHFPAGSLISPGLSRPDTRVQFNR